MGAGASNDGKWMNMGAIGYGRGPITYPPLSFLGPENTRVAYRAGIFWSVSVSISWYLKYRYRSKTQSVLSVL